MKVMDVENNFSKRGPQEGKTINKILSLIDGSAISKRPNNREGNNKQKHKGVTSRATDVYIKRGATENGCLSYAN